VGPARIGYGTVIAAGTICRRDCPEGGRLLTAAQPADQGENSRNFVPGRYGNIGRKVLNNLTYIANILALKTWYLHVRQPFFRRMTLGEALFEGVMEVLQQAAQERLNRFRNLAEKMESSLLLLPGVNDRQKREELAAQQCELSANWPEVEGCFTCGQEEAIGTERRNIFLDRIEEKIVKTDSDYLSMIQTLDQQTTGTGTAWLQEIVDILTRQALTYLPACEKSKNKRPHA